MTLVKLGILLAAGVVATAACGGETDRVRTTADGGSDAAIRGDDTAIATCRARQSYTDTRLVAAYETTLGDVLEWDRKQFHPPGWDRPPIPQAANRPDSDPVTTCLVDGTFNFGALANDRAPNRALLVIDASGEVWLQVAGFHNVSGRREFPVERPSASVEPAPPPVTKT